MTNRVTAVMLAAASMKPAQIYQDIHEREQWPYKADTPEHGLDLHRIFETARQSRGFQYARDSIILVVTLIGLFNLIERPSFDDYYGGPRINWLAVFLTLAIVAATHFYFQRLMRGRARKVLREVAEEGQDADSTVTQATANANVIISGGYSPFVGSGFDRRSWSFTVDLKKPADESDPVDELLAQDLYAETQKDIEELRLPKLSACDLVCVDGRDVGDLGDLLHASRHHKPQASLSPAQLKSLIGQNQLRMRHYKVLRANLWGGQLIFSVFLRYVIQGNLLFVEARIFELPPLKNEFLAYESMPDQPDMKEIREDLVLSIISSPVLWIPVALRVAAFASGGWATLFHNPQKTNAEAIDRDRKFNYGWPQSLREHWGSRQYERYFQAVDVDFYEKSIKDALLESLLHSLEKRNISIEAFKAASTTIYNDGIMMSGGNIETQALSTGRGATAAVNKALSAVRPGGEKKAAA